MKYRYYVRKETEMKMKRLVSKLLIFVMTLMLVAPASEAFAAVKQTVKISKVKAPTSITAGKDFTVKGIIKSSKKIKRVEIGVTTKGGGKWTSQKYDNRRVNSKTFSVSKANRKLKFNKLEPGTYYYRIYAHTANKKVKVVLNKKFTVKAKYKPYVKSYTYPKQINNGEGFVIKGIVKASEKIKKVEIGVVNRKSGKWTSQKYAATVNKKSFNIKKADPYIKFGQLASGNYCYRVNVTTGSGTTNVLSKAFTVKEVEEVETQAVASDVTSSCNAGLYSGVKVSGGNLPSNYKVGKVFNVKGTIKSNEIINKIEIGIVFEPTNKWTTYKYTESNVNSKTFDIARAADKLSFNKLPGGNFRYRIYAHTASGVKIALDYPFKVTPSSRPKAAVKWAKKIAADDTFTYGKKPKANAVGCYFCGTNCGPVKHTKPKGYEKTYVCLTFVGAAYAHGAKDPEILAQCKKGRMTIYETNDNFKKFSCWMKLGSCRELTVDDLQVGDVIIKWSDRNDNSGHVCMYIGGNDLVESSGGGWDANSIAVKKDAAATRLKYLSLNKKNYVMRYVK